MERAMDDLLPRVEIRFTKGVGLKMAKDDKKEKAKPKPWNSPRYQEDFYPPRRGKCAGLEKGYRYSEGMVDVPLMVGPQIWFSLVMSPVINASNWPCSR